MAKRYKKIVLMVFLKKFLARVNELFWVQNLGLNDFFENFAQKGQEVH